MYRDGCIGLDEGRNRRKKKSRFSLALYFRKHLELDLANRNTQSILVTMNMTVNTKGYFEISMKPYSFCPDCRCDCETKVNLKWFSV